MTNRDIRVQAAVIRDNAVLVLQVLLADGRQFWLLPGGGREPEDTDDAVGAVREVREEVGLEVVAERVLLDKPANAGDSTYTRYRTFLCVCSNHDEPVWGIRDGTALISQVRWIPLDKLDQLDARSADIANDMVLFPQLVAIRDALAVSGTSAPPSRHPTINDR